MKESAWHFEKVSLHLLGLSDVHEGGHVDPTMYEGDGTPVKTVFHWSDFVHWCCTWHTQKGSQNKELSHLHCSFKSWAIHLLLDKIHWIHLLCRSIFVLFHEQIAAHCFSSFQAPLDAPSLSSKERLLSTGRLFSLKSRLVGSNCLLIVCTFMQLYWEIGISNISSVISGKWSCFLQCHTSSMQFCCKVGKSSSKIKTWGTYFWITIILPSIQSGYHKVPCNICKFIDEQIAAHCSFSLYRLNSSGIFTRRPGRLHVSNATQRETFNVETVRHSA